MNYPYLYFVFATILIVWAVFKCAVKIREYKIKKADDKTIEDISTKLDKLNEISGKFDLLIEELRRKGGGTK